MQTSFFINWPTMRVARWQPAGQVADSLPVCGARQKLRLAKQTRFLPTAAHTAPSLHLPLAALGLVAHLKNGEIAPSLRGLSEQLTGGVSYPKKRHSLHRFAVPLSGKPGQKSSIFV